MGFSVALIGIVFCMEREQEEPIEESIRIESIVDEWANQLRGGRFNPRVADEADVKLVLNYLKNKQFRNPWESALASSLNDELSRRAVEVQSKHRLSDIKDLEEELVGYATSEEALPLNVDFLNSLLSSIITYRIATNKPEGFVDLEGLVLATLDSLGEKRGVGSEVASLVPVNNLQELGLCPLYPRIETIKINGQTVESVLPVHYSKVVKIPQPDWQIVEISQKIKEQGIEGEQAALEKTKLQIQKLPCWIDISAELGISNRAVQLIQLKTINQDEVSETVGACPTLALRNSLQMFDFVSSGDVNFLKSVPSSTEAASFINVYGCIKWASIEEIEKFFQAKAFGPIKDKIAFLPTLLLVNDEYYQLAEPSMQQVVEKTKQIIQDGLKKDQFFYTLVVGNEEKTQMGKGIGHYYSLSIIKSGNTTQYVVIDSQATKYYLYTEFSERLVSKELELYESIKEPSYELKLLLYFIETMEKGASNRLDLKRDTPLQP